MKSTIIFLFCGFMAMYCLFRALQLPAESWKRLYLYDSSITWIRILPSGEVDLYSLGDVGHLPRDHFTH